MNKDVKHFPLTSSAWAHWFYRMLHPRYQTLNTPFHPFLPPHLYPQGLALHIAMLPFLLSHGQKSETAFSMLKNMALFKDGMHSSIKYRTLTPAFPQAPRGDPQAVRVHLPFRF